MPSRYGGQQTSGATLLPLHTFCSSVRPHNQVPKKIEKKGVLFPSSPSLVSSPFISQSESMRKPDLRSILLVFVVLATVTAVLGMWRSGRAASLDFVVVGTPEVNDDDDLVLSSQAHLANTTASGDKTMMGWLLSGAAIDQLANPLPDLNYSSCMVHCIARNQRPVEIAPDEPCTEEDSWCPSNYTPEKIQDVCHLMCRNQYPADCSKAKFFIVTKDWGNGYGSDLHIRLLSFTFALTEGRVFMYSPQVQSMWTHPQDEYPPCASRNPWCYYLPITSCVLPANWTSLSVPYLKSKPTTQYVTRPSANEIKGPSGIFTELSTPKRGTKFSNVTVLWWKGHLAQFLYRPNAHMMQTVILPSVLKTFQHHPKTVAQLLPSRYLCVFIRQGDKYLESPLHSPQEYWSAIKTKAETLNITDVYLSSDSESGIRDTIALSANFTPKLSFYYINHTRLETGLTMNYLTTHLWNKPGVRDMINLDLTDLFIASRAIAWIGTLSSNWCKLLFSFRSSAVELNAMESPMANILPQVVCTTN